MRATELQKAARMGGFFHEASLDYETQRTRFFSCGRYLNYDFRTRTDVEFAFGFHTTVPGWYQFGLGLVGASQHSDLACSTFCRHRFAVVGDMNRNQRWRGHQFGVG